MIPSPLIEFSVWANLDRYKNLELILLKGHLFIDVILLNSLNEQNKPLSTKPQNMSFYRKFKELEKHAESGSPMGLALHHTAALNTIHNKLAHEPFVENINSQVVCWAENVLIDFPCTKHQKYTQRTKTTQALATLAKVLYEAGTGEDYKVKSHR